MPNRKQQRQAKQAAAKQAEQTPVAAKTPRTPAPKSPAVLAAEKAAAKDAKPKVEPRPTCTSTKQDGTPCTAKAKTGCATCVDHQPAIDRLTDDERAKIGGLLAGLDEATLIELLVSEVGWHRAKAIAKTL